MTSFVYLNDGFVEKEKAFLPIWDRSILFSDAVYEVICFIDGAFLDFSLHIVRLKSSLQKLDIDFAIDELQLLQLHRELIRRNNVQTGSVYLQVSRGVTERDFYYDNSVQASFFMFVKPVLKQKLLEEKILKVASVEEGRWAYRDIKTTQLLYSSLMKTQLRAKGFDDAVYLEDGFITEATSANFHMIDKNGILVTHPLDRKILPGITRHTLLHLAKDQGIKVEERPFTLEEALQAQELFISSATTFATPVGALNGHEISGGKIGPVVKKLRQLYIENVSRKI